MIINDVLGVGAVVVLHVFRFQLSGRICSGDYGDDTTDFPYAGRYLTQQGQFLIGLVVVVWAGGALLCGISACVALFSFKSALNGLIGKILNAWRSVSLLHRMQKGNQNDLLNYQFLFQTFQSLAIFVAVASYLWHTETNEICNAPLNNFVPSPIISVDKRFRDILKIWWTYALVDFWRSIIAIIAVNSKSRCFGWVYQILVLNDLLGFAAIIIVHVYRFQYAGQWCSGDFLDNGNVYRPGYLIERGKILVGLIIFSWVGLLTYGCLLSCLITAASRRDGHHVESMDNKVGDEDKEKQALVKFFVSHKPYELEIQTIIAACSAASCGHLKILQRLCQIGISMDAGDYDKRTPLHIAASAGHLDVVKYLLSIGVKVSPRDRWGATPLNDAKTKDIENFLLSHGAERGIQSSYTPIRLQNLTDEEYRLYYAAFNNDAKNMAIMNIQGWKVNAYDYDGRTALGIAASEGHLEAVQYLINNGANIKHRDSRGNNALDDAIREKRSVTVDYLKSYMLEHKD